MKNRGKKDYQKISTAYHEAAHSIFATLSFFKIDRVELKGNSPNTTKYEICGLTSFYSPINYVSSKSLKKKFANSEIIVNYSGVVGETVLFAEISGLKEAPSHIKSSGQFDRENSKKIIKQFFTTNYSNIASFKKRKEKIIKSLLKIYWSDVKKIAALLLRRKKLSYKEIKGTLVGKSENKDFWKRRFECIDSIFHGDVLVVSESALKEILKNQEKLW